MNRCPERIIPEKPPVPNEGTNETKSRANNSRT
jgi:hypothetical protein